MTALVPLQIGAVRTRTNMFLSPMSGVTDSAFRRLVLRCSGDAVGLVVSEFIAAEGLTRDNEKTIRMLRFLECERPISIQIFGADIDRMVRAAVMVEESGADIVDINCGCPAPKVVRRGGGAALMKQPQKLASVLRAVREAVTIPMTVKIRAGWDDNCANAPDIARIAEAEGASMVAVHGRTRVQLYSGDADWELVASVRAALSIPVIGSGDVSTVETAKQRLDRGYGDGIMVGRGALDNPWIFSQIRCYLRGERVVEPVAAERVSALAAFRDALRETLPDRAFLGRYRGFACRMVKGRGGAAAARRAIGNAGGVEDVDRLFAEFMYRQTDVAADMEQVA